MTTKPKALAALAEQSGTKFILALFVDLNGKPCAKLVPVEAVDELATNGVGFAGFAVRRRIHKSPISSNRAGAVVIV